MLGKEVMSSLSEFFGQSYPDGRRSMGPIAEEDYITDTVKTAALCRDLHFCLSTRKFIDEFIIVLSKSIETILSNSLKDRFKIFIFEEHLKHSLLVIRYILQETNIEITEEKRTYYWMNTIKKICAIFQEMSSVLISEDLQIDKIEMKKIKRALNHKIIIATVLVELNYNRKLCTEHNICIASYKITKSLNNLLEELKGMQDEKVRSFIRYFYEALFETSFYSHINQITAHELQVILNDMAYSNEMPTKEILSIVKKVIDIRLDSIESYKDYKLSYDALLVHGILSDMDHFYSENKESFGIFFQRFYDWAKLDVRLDKHIGQVLKDIGKDLWVVSDDLFIKLMNEVKVFLELTVDPQELI